MNDVNRINILEFLTWNDKNGCYLDTDVRAITQEPFTFHEAKLMFWDVLFRDKILMYIDYDNPLELNYDSTCKYLIKNNLNEISNKFIESFIKKDKLKTYNKIRNSI